MKTVQISTITEVPGVQSIIVEPDEGSARGVHVRLVTSMDLDQGLEGESFGLEELDEYIVALQTAHRLGLDLAQAIERDTPGAPGTPEPRKLRIWDNLGDIPGDVKIILDEEKDPYFRSQNGWALRPGADRYQLAGTHGPFTEVIL